MIIAESVLIGRILAGFSCGVAVGIVINLAGK